MSADNSIARDRNAEQPTSRAGFEIPPALAARYEVRIIDAPGGEQRLGLFSPGSRDHPAIEITDDRIVARREDAETIASLVEIAQHNGWERITVEGSAEFRRAVWTAATREGLVVSGFEPTFLEQERAEQARKDAAERAGRATAQPVPSTAQTTPSSATVTEQSQAAQVRSDARTTSSEVEMRSGDDRWPLLAPTRHVADRSEVYAAPERDVATWEREDRATVTGSSPSPARPAERSPVQDEQAPNAPAERHNESEALAELFLNGGSGRIAGEPRLTGALQAQLAMEQHLGEVFDGDPRGMSSASLESRHLISDALRRGLDVSVREPAPVRQLLPAQTRPDLER